MKNFISKIINGEFLTYDESKQLIYSINEDQIKTEELTAVLIGIQMRGVQLNEIAGCRDALLELVLPISLNGGNAIDLCGTGGDGKDTFNISTTTSLVLAAMGYKVMKHGNYAVSSSCGSSNVLEELGFVFKKDQLALEKDLNELNICFLHAPLFHPVMKKVAPIRKNLGVRTLFNSLGPLVNPVQPAYQMTGTYSLELAQIYHHVLRNNRKNYKVMYGLNGYDELTLTDDTKILGKNDNGIRNAENFNIDRISPSQLIGGNTIQASAKIVRNILKGEGSIEHSNVISANVAEALNCFDSNLHLIDSFNEVKAFIASGQASKHFKIN